MYYGLVLGKSECNLPAEYASKAIDVDLSWGDIRPIKCPIPVCDIEGGCLDYVDEDCCKGEYSHVCYTNGIVAVENGSLYKAESPCDEHTPLCVPTPTEPLEIDPIACECGSVTTVIRYANVVDGVEGALSAPSNIGNLTDLTFPNPVALYVQQGEGWFYQGTSDTFDFSDGFNKLGFPPKSEGWCGCPSDVKFLVKHQSGSLMTVSGDTLHISHPACPHLWGKYDLKHCREIIALIETQGNVFAFDGIEAYVVEQTRLGFALTKYADDVCIKSHKQLSVYNGSIFSMTREGLKSITGSQYNRSNFSLLNAELISPTFFCGDDFKMGVCGTKVHFTDGERAFIYDLTVDPKFALTESSLVPQDYQCTCDGMHYLVDGKVLKWNPCEGETYCPYTYCTGRQRLEDCDNIGVINVEGTPNGGSETEVFYYDCQTTRSICKIPTCLCKNMAITGCENTNSIKVCFTGLDIICNHTADKSTRDITHG